MSDEALPPPGQVKELLESVASFGVPAPGSARVLDVGTQPFIEFFQQELLGDLAASGSAFCRFFEGPYGGGKTHLLQLIEDAAGGAGMALVRADLSQAMKLDDWRLVCRFVLGTMSAWLEGQPVKTLPGILQAMEQAGIANQDRLSEARLPHSGFKQAMLYALQTGPNDEDRLLPLQRFLLGERVTVAELRRHGFLGVKDPLSVRNAEHVLSTVVGGLYSAGLPGVVLLFDESERTFSGRSQKVRIAANLIRRMIDGALDGRLNGAMIVFAVLPGFLADCSEVYPALGQRLAASPESLEGKAWRAPVLSIGAVSGGLSPEDFGYSAAERLLSLAKYCGLTSGIVTALEESLARAVGRVLFENAGQGFRRPLMKVLSTLTLQALEEV